MHIHIKAINLELTDSVDTYTREKISKLEKLLTNHQNEAGVADVILTFAPHDTRDTKDKCAITISGLGHGTTFHAECEEHDMHVAIDACEQKMAEQLRREKDKQHDHISRENQAAKELPVEQLMETEPVDDDVDASKDAR